ncbi:hypothetical protein ABT104_07860 [Streptomyces mobaraensis]|uniref:hypothetical protein n=1 Tax=Streptomyces mobaraensis TaxID=35621 RepID=UPI0033296CA8
MTSGGTSITALKPVAGARRAGVRLELTTVLRERTVRRILAAQPDAVSRTSPKKCPSDRFRNAHSPRWPTAASPSPASAGCSSR